MQKSSLYKPSDGGVLSGPAGSSKVLLSGSAISHITQKSDGFWEFCKWTFHEVIESVSNCYKQIYSDTSYSNTKAHTKIDY